MASSLSLASGSSHLVLLPAIPELHNPNFLDVLVPANPVRPTASVPHVATNPMIDALKSTSRQTFTANAAPAYSATDSATLNAFSSISRYTKWEDLASYLQKSWKEDSNLTLRIIWNLRSIHDGKGEKESFYRAFGWLYNKHPRTALSNLHLLVEPVCKASKKRTTMSHGYWKDLLNILALQTVGELSNTSSPSTFLHAPRQVYTYRNRWHAKKKGRPASRIEAAQLANDKASSDAAGQRKLRQRQMYDRLVGKLHEPQFRALFIAVARLFSDQLLRDIKVLDDLNTLGPGDDRIAHLKKLSLAGKWAPTPGGSHDRVTNIATAIGELMYASQAFPAYPSVLNTSISDVERAHVLRSFYQRWVLTELRRNLFCPEPLMSANRWTEIKYTRVPSICMKNNQELFFKHDPTRFEQFLIGVESGKKKISGATLLPHELVAQAAQFERNMSHTTPDKNPALKEFKKKVSEIQLRVIEGQWKTLIDSLREAGSIQNSLAVCDVSGSMGNIWSKYDKKYIYPILPAVSLSLVLATLAEPPFNGGFITFSAHPQFVTVDLDQSLGEQIRRVASSDWGMNTDFTSVFLRLLLPLAVKNKIKQEDMIKRLFVFSDMQFDDSVGSTVGSDAWETNYVVIEKAYKKAGYEVPEIVYWNLSANGGRMTKETDDSKKKGVAMVNGFSSAMLKVFMGEEESGEWEKVEEDGSVTVVEEKAEFNPFNVMMKALMKESFDGLVVVD